MAQEGGEEAASATSAPSDQCEHVGQSEGLIEASSGLSMRRNSKNPRPGQGSVKTVDRSKTRKFLEIDGVLQQIKQVQFENATGRSSTKSWRSISTRWTALTTSKSSLSVVSGQTVSGCLGAARNLVNHRHFNLTIAFFICLHALFIGLETEFHENNEEFSIGWYLAELSFTLIFLGEFLLRLAATQQLQRFLYDRWNLFDFVLVSTSCIDTFVITFISRISRGSLVGAFRAVRLFRVARMLRLLRFFHEMWQLVAGIVEAMWTLLWTWLLLLIIIYVCGIFTTRTIGQQYQSDVDLQSYFGNVPRSMFTLFQITTTDGWAEIARKAMRMNAWTAGFFVLYLYVTTCAVLNVVVAVIVENTLDQAVDQRQKFTTKQSNKQTHACAKLYQLFCGMDDNGDGMLTKAEFSEALKDEQMSRYLHQLGIDLRQAEELFSILDFDESGSLDAQEFVGGVLKAVGNGKAREVLALHCDLSRSKRKVNDKIKEVHRQAASQTKRAHEGVQDLRKEVMKLVNSLAEASGMAQLAPSDTSQLPGRGARKATAKASKAKPSTDQDQVHRHCADGLK